MLAGKGRSNSSRTGRSQMSSRGCRHSTLRICESIGSESTRTVDVDFTADDSNDDVEPGDEDGSDGDSERGEAVAECVRRSACPCRDACTPLAQEWILSPSSAVRSRRVIASERSNGSGRDATCGLRVGRRRRVVFALSSS